MAPGRDSIGLKRKNGASLSASQEADAPASKRRKMPVCTSLLALCVTALVVTILAVLLGMLVGPLRMAAVCEGSKW